MAIKKQPNFRKKPTDYSVLEVDPYVKKWIESYAEKHRRPRLSVLTDFIEFTGKTPKELIIEHLKDIRQDDPLNQVGIAKKQLKDFYNFLINERMISKNTAIQHVFSKLQGFWAKNNVPIILSKGEKPTMSQKGKKDKVMRDKNKQRIRDKKEIFKRVRDTLKNTRDRAILLSKLSTGIDDVDLFALKIKDFRNGYFEDLKVCYIEGHRIKPVGNPIYQAILNSEACNLLEIYLAERKQVKKEDLDMEDYLFVNNKDHSKKIGSSSFADNLRKTVEILGVKNLTPKYFRNWTITVLKKEGIPSEIVERIVGHKKPISETYEQIFNDPEGFVEEFADKINEITSLGNGNKKYARLEDKLDILKGVVADKEIQMNQMQKDLDFLLKATKEYSAFFKDFKSKEIPISTIKISEKGKEIIKEIIDNK